MSNVTNGERVVNLAFYQASSMFCSPASDDDDGFDSYQLNPFFCCIGINVAIFHSARCTPAEFKVREGDRG